MEHAHWPWSFRRQLTPDALISNEQFAAGGLDSVRGTTRAKCWGTTACRLAWNGAAPNLGPRLWKPLDNLYGFGFVDGARLLLNDPLPGPGGQPPRCSVPASACGCWPIPLTAGLDLAVPFRDGASTEEGDERLLFSLRYGF